MSFSISGVHFQRSLRGAGSSLTLAALTSFDGLPILTSHGITAEIRQASFRFHPRNTSANIFVPSLHIFKEILCALHKNNPFERGMFTHDSTAAISSYNELEKEISF